MTKQQYNFTEKVKLTKAIFWEFWLFKKGQVINVTKDEKEYLLNEKVAVNYSK